MAKSEGPSDRPDDARRKATRPLDPSAAIARIPVGSKRSSGDGQRLAGPVIGWVTGHDDPDGGGRVEVQFQHDAVGEEPVRRWCRLVATGAGEGRGIAFRPEIDDEVVIGFVEGDSKRPVVFGGLWNVHNPPPVESDDDNSDKALVTRSGLRIDFDDDDGAVTIETRAGRRIRLDDDAGDCTLEDAHGNSIVLDANGITIRSAGRLTFAAGGAVVVEGAALTGNVPTASFAGSISAETVEAVLIDAENYAPGAGNIV